MVAFAMMLGCLSMGLGRVFMMFGCLIVFVSCHRISPWIARPKAVCSRLVFCQCFRWRNSRSTQSCNSPLSLCRWSRISSSATIRPIHEKRPGWSGIRPGLKRYRQNERDFRVIEPGPPPGLIPARLYPANAVPRGCPERKGPARCACRAARRASLGG